jgi:4-amino-4-deoxy-L-arabinose transferase-like glycosyltransferase
VSRKREWTAIVVILLLAAGLRLWRLGAVPPGLSHDEVANGLIAKSILGGQHRIYFTAAYGHEPLFQYAQAATVALFGDHWLGLRWPSFAFGLLGIAATYALVRRLFGPSVALPTAAWLSISFWPLFYARVGLRTITLPFVAALAAIFLFRTVERPPTTLSRATARDLAARPVDRPTRQTINTLLAGLFLGLSFYTYMAARVLPFIFVAYLIYLHLVARPASFPWHRLIVLFLIAVVVASPLWIWLATHPGAEYRISEVREPLDRLLAGDPALVWRNLIRNLGFLTFTGDPWPHQGIPGRPVFVDPISPWLFYAGLLIALWRWRDPRYGFLLIWGVGALVPSVLSSHAPPDLPSDAPSSVRDILALVVVFAFPALALAEAGRWIKWRLRDRRLAARLHQFSPLAALLLIPCLSLTVRDYFIRWPHREDVRYFYQTDLTTVGRELDRLGPGTPVAVAGLSVHSMDRPTLEFSTQTSAQSVRLCDTRQTLVIPADPEARILVPRVVPFDVQGALEDRLAAWTEVKVHPSFTSYRVRDSAALDRQLRELDSETTLPDGTPVDVPVSFAGRLSFLGYEWLERSWEPGGTLALLTYWRVEVPPVSRIKVFVHLLDQPAEAGGEIVAQGDGLGSPPQGWEAGDLLVQKHILSLPADLPWPEHDRGQYPIHIGLYYDSDGGARLSALTADHLLLYSPGVPE